MEAGTIKCGVRESRAQVGLGDEDCGASSASVQVGSPYHHLKLCSIGISPQLASSGMVNWSWAK